jgi:hypothetical protein
MLEHHPDKGGNATNFITVKGQLEQVKVFKLIMTKISQKQTLTREEETFIKEQVYHEPPQIMGYQSAKKIRTHSLKYSPY